jgi:hypothetical protein
MYLEILVSANTMQLFSAVVIALAIYPFVYTVKMDITKRFGQPRFVTAEVSDVIVEVFYPGGFGVSQRIKVYVDGTDGKVLNGRWIPAPMRLMCRPHDKVKIACLAGRFWVVHPDKYYE